MWGKVVRVVGGIDGGKTGVAAVMEQYNVLTGNDPSIF